MERFKLIDGVLVAPSQNGTSVGGEVISNFGGRIAADESFAVANGYFPKSDIVSKKPDDGISYWKKYRLEKGEWVTYYEPCEEVGVHREKKRVLRLPEEEE